MPKANTTQLKSSHGNREHASEKDLLEKQLTMLCFLTDGEAEV
jgi:hypothetical protein